MQRSFLGRRGNVVIKRTAGSLLQLLLVGAWSTNLALPQKADSASDAEVGKAAPRPEIPKSLIGKPEKISGTISMVLPEQRLIVLTVPANSVPKFLMVLEDRTTITQKPEGVVKHHKRVILTQSDEANFNFKVTDSTSIRVDGRRMMSGSLEALNNKQATVRFVPLRSGNMAQVIEVGR